MNTIEKNAALMNAQELIQITPEWDTSIKKGTLIGFKGLGGNRGITASYPVWRVIGKEIQFVLFWSQETGRPCIDNTWFTSSDLFINKEPIVLDIEIENPQSFHSVLANAFTFTK